MVSRETEVVVLGTVPPPVTGMTLMTEVMVEALQKAGPIRFFNWSTGISRRGLKFRTARVLRTLQSFFWLLTTGRSGKSNAYIVANSKGGLYLTACVVGIARRLGHPVYLHHHVYSYIDRYDRRMAWIDRCMGPESTHVVHCEKMAQDFLSKYASRCRFEYVYPSVVAMPLSSPRTALRAPFRLGLLSNLSIAKGLGRAIDTFKLLRRAGRDVALDLAGPVQAPADKRLIAETVAAFPDRVRYLGPIYGDEKVRYFNEIDAFLFPTEYENESWGIVLHEAMAAGVPVITFDRGCTQTVVGERGGLVVARDANFAEVAARQIKSWLDHEDVYREASSAAVAQADSLQREGRRMLEEFATNIHRPAPAKAF